MAIVGKCLLMCPTQERIAYVLWSNDLIMSNSINRREKDKRLHILEINKDLPDDSKFSIVNMHILIMSFQFGSVSLNKPYGQ